MQYKNLDIRYWIYYWILMVMVKIHRYIVKYHQHKDLIKAWAVCIVAALAVWLMLLSYYRDL